MSKILEWLAANAAWLVPVTVLVLTNVANGLVRHPAASSWVHTAIDLVSFFAKRGSVDQTLKWPLTTSRKPPSSANAAPPPTPPLAAAALLPLVLGLSALLSCTAAQGRRVAVDFASCSIGRVPDAARLLVPDLVTAAGGSPTDWASAEAGLSGLAADDAVCVLMAALHDLGEPRAAARNPTAADRLRVALAARGVK